MHYTRIKSYIRALTMPLLLIAFIVCAASVVIGGMAREAGSLFGLTAREWSSIHGTSGWITIWLALVHVLLDLKTLLWSCKYVFTFWKKPPHRS